MASVLVYVERDDGRSSPRSREALGLGRRIATRAGAALYALCPVADEAVDPEETIADLGRAGADKVVLLRGAEYEGPPVWERHGRAAAAVCRDLAPRLVLFPAGAAGPDLGPRLAAHLGSAFLAEPSIEWGPGGEVSFARRVYGGAGRRELRALELEHGAVVTLARSSSPPAEGADDADVVFFEREPEPRPFGIEPDGEAPDPGADLEEARVVVAAGAGAATPESFALVEELARALGGEVAVTPSLRRRGFGSDDRVVGVGLRQLAPALYVACGAAGSPGHLGAVSASARIVAIHSDPSAPIFRAASYGIVGAVKEVLPELLSALAPRRAGAVRVAEPLEARASAESAGTSLGPAGSGSSSRGPGASAAGQRTVVLLRQLRRGRGVADRTRLLGNCERAALRTGLALRALVGGSVTAIAAGRAGIDERALELALRAGCDRAELIDAGELDDLDYLGVGRILAAAAARAGADVILCGARSSDEARGAVGPAVAELLDTPHLGGVIELRPDPERSGALLALRRAGGALQRFRCHPPFLAAVAAAGPIGRPEGAPAASGAPRAGARPDRLTLADVGISAEELRHRARLRGRDADPPAGALLFANAGDLVARLHGDELLPR